MVLNYILVGCPWIEFSSVLKTNRTTFQLPNFPSLNTILAYSPFRAFFGKPSFVILNHNSEAFIIAVCFSFVIFNAESICSPAWLFDKKKKGIWVFSNSVNKAPRFHFGKPDNYCIFIRFETSCSFMKLDFLKTLFIVNEITRTLKITSNRCKNLCHSPCNSTRVIFQL